MKLSLMELRSKVFGKDVASMQALQLLNDSQDAWQKSMETLLAMYWPPQDDNWNLRGIGRRVDWLRSVDACQRI